MFLLPAERRGPVELNFSEEVKKRVFPERNWATRKLLYSQILIVVVLYLITKFRKHILMQWRVQSLQNGRWNGIINLSSAKIVKLPLLENVLKCTYLITQVINKDSLKKQFKMKYIGLVNCFLVCIIFKRLMEKKSVSLIT